jgi:nucleoside-diphosphate-sugar epimerase
VLKLDLVRVDLGTLIRAMITLRPAFVVNAAGALWNVTADDLTDGNVRLVNRLVHAVATLPDPVRLVHIGSAYEYGSQPGQAALSETLACRPTSQYAQTKLAGTRIVGQAVSLGRIDATVLRIATSVGPHAPAQSLLGGLARQLAARPDVLRLPPIDGVRDIVAVHDVADAVLRMAAVRTVPPVVNIGSGTSVNLTDAVDTLIGIAGSTAPIERGPAPAERRDAGVGSQPLDIALARQLGWAPTRTLRDALEALWHSMPVLAGVASHSTNAVDGEHIHG